MPTYELDDHDVTIIVDALKQRPSHMSGELIARIKLQLPIPTNIGAVIKTDSKTCAPDLSIFIRYASDIQTSKPWILREELDLRTYGSSEVGRIIGVLAEGVEV